MLRFPLCLFLLFDLTFFIYSMLGPVDLKFKRTENCDPPLNNIYFWVQQFRYNRSHEYMNITLFTPFVVDSSVIMKLNASMKKEGGWKPGAFYYEDEMCKVLEKMLGDKFDEMLEMSGFDKRCPMQAGDYIIRNYFYDNSKLSGSRVYGEYMMEVTAHKFIDNQMKIQACYLLFYDFDPKPIL